MNSRPRIPWKPLIFVLCLLPLAGLAYQAAMGGLGANPIEKVTRDLGEWALRFLAIGLALTPLRQAQGWHWLAQFRRMIGLYAFFYACLHVASYVVLDQFFDWGAIGKDIVKRPYITVGMIAFVLLVPLAVTSTKGMVRRLGGRRWRRLHRLVYVAAPLGVVHFVMLVKADLRDPLFYGVVLALLLGHRLLSAAPTLLRRMPVRAEPQER